MNNVYFSVLLLGASILLAGIRATAQESLGKPITWKECLHQKPGWYSTKEAIRVADQVVLYQRVSGGWPKNVDMAKPLTDKEKADLFGAQEDPKATIDNGATFTQVAYLARVYNSTKQEPFKSSFMKGLDYLLEMQYPNGGWPQFYPNPTGYQTHITFNDNAMVGVLELFRDIIRRMSDYTFVDDGRRKRCERALTNGIDCILKCQVFVDGTRTVWCAQHDEVTLKPAPARTYEKISLSGGESVGIVRFLMGIEKPATQVIDAIQSAVAWFERVKQSGIKLVEKQNADAPKGFDKVVEKEPNAEPLWARFYEIGTNRPIFSGRDGVVKYSLKEIEIERRTGYSWYGTGPAKLLERDYPEWRKKWLNEK